MAKTTNKETKFTPDPKKYDPLLKQLSELKKLEDKYLQDSLSIIKDNSKKGKENIFVENNENDNKILIY